MKPFIREVLVYIGIPPEIDCEFVRSVRYILVFPSNSFVSIAKTLAFDLPWPPYMDKTSLLPVPVKRPIIFGCLEDNSRMLGR